MDNQKVAWYILDEIAVLHSAAHTGNSHTGEAPLCKDLPRVWFCPICDRAQEAMRLLKKPTHKECKELYDKRKDRF